MKIDRWMMNKSTGVVFPYNEKHISDENNTHLVECDENGAPITAKEDAAEPKAPAAPAPKQPDPAPEPKAPEAVADVPPVLETAPVPLKDIPVAELKDIAKDLGIELEAGMNKAAVIAAITAKQQEVAGSPADSE